MYILSAFVAELNKGVSPEPEENVFSSIWNEYERVIMQSLVTAFGLDFLVHDQHGGDVDTIHNVVLNDLFPTIYRIDRIQGLKVLEERYRIPYSDRFEKGEFRKRIQFMYGGTLRKIKFEYFGFSVESVLDRLPTAKIEKTEKSSDGKRNVYTISAEVFGDGIDMWLRSQGENIKIL